MKILSGDFAAEYNRALTSLKEEQEALDKKYEDIIMQIVKREEIRLEDNPPDSLPSFNIGDNVKTVDGNAGIIRSFNVNLDPTRPPDYDYSDIGSYGPSRYFPLQTLNDEYVFASPEIMYQYDVEVEASEFEKDWGHNNNVHTFYADELSIESLDE